MPARTRNFRQVRPPSAQPIGEVLSELEAPASDRLVGEDNAALRQKQLDVAEAERERMIEPDRVGDDRGREAVAMVQVRRSSHPATLADPAPAGHPPLT
jgi:hypothetical protein